MKARKPTYKNKSIIFVEGICNPKCLMYNDELACFEANEAYSACNVDGHYLLSLKDILKKL